MAALRNLRDGGMREGMFWNYVALVVLAGSGLAMQSVIGGYFGAAALGVFNQVFAWYIATAQLGVIGAQFSVLKHLSDEVRSVEETAAIAFAGLLLAFSVGSIAAIALYTASDWIGWIAGSEDVAFGIKLAAPGVMLFALNKVAISVLNGTRRMIAFAFFQAVRPLMLLIAAIGMVGGTVPAVFIPGILSLTELVLLVLFIPALAPVFARASAGGLMRWLLAHLSFGARSAPSGILTELNSRADVVILGVFASDSMVGLYSFAAILAEGVAQTLVVVRNNINPYLTEMLASLQSAEEAFVEFIAKWKKLSYLVALGAAGIGAIGYVVLVWLMSAPQFMDAYLFFGVILIGIVLAAPYIPFAQILMLAGYPGWHTIAALAVVVINIGMNWILAQWIGALGSAIAMTLSILMAWALLKFLVRRLLHTSL